MEKLELKHLSPYLPYGLKCQWFRTEDQKLVINELNITDYYWLIGRQQFKPILSPMSDCHKDINNDNFLCVDSCFVSPIKLWNGKETFQIHPTEAEWIFVSDVYENFYEYLFANHFDVFGLIEKGLAVDIKSVNDSL